MQGTVTQGQIFGRDRIENKIGFGIYAVYLHEFGSGIVGKDNWLEFRGEKGLERRKKKKDEGRKEEGRKGKEWIGREKEKELR